MCLSYEFERSPERSPNDVDEVVETFLREWTPQMRKFVAKAGDISSLVPSWKPQYPADKNFVDHISTLHIPMGGDKRPSLLLHDLGEERRSNPSTERAIRDIFSHDIHTCVFYLPGMC
jgi:hypothetical protein